MINGKCPTWFVVKWLEKHPRHTAKAPAVNNLREARAYAGNSWVVFEYLGRSGWGYAHGLINRSDWTIYEEHGRPVRFKRKVFIVDAGIAIRAGERVEVLVSDVSVAASYVSPVSGDVLIRETCD